MRTRAELSACWAILLLAGCMGETEVAGGRQNLGVCPDGVRPGMPCEAANDIACESEGLLCWCTATEDGREGIIECQEHDTNPIQACSAEGILACYNGGDMERCRFEDGRICSCARDTTSERPSVVCEVPPPPTPEECTVDHIDACVAGERTECRYPSGRTCACYPTDRGAELFCVEDPSVPPNGCDEDALRRCLAGEPVQCAYSDGRVCGCFLREDGTIGFRCDELPPVDPNECTEEDYEACARGEQIECVSGGQLCSCGNVDTSGTSGGLVCHDPSPTGGCTDEDYRRCQAGEQVECVFADGRVCRCGGDSTAEDFYCEPAPTDPPACTEEHYRACLDTTNANFVCRDAAGTLCSCGPGGLVCQQPPTTEEDRCTDADYAACAAGQEVRCVGDAGTLCTCSNPDSGTEGGRLICG